MQERVPIARLRPWLRRLRWNQAAVDVAIAALLVAIVFIGARATHLRLDPLAALLLVLMTLPIAFRRRAPMHVLAITGFATTAYLLIGYPDVGGPIGTYVAFFTVAETVPRREALAAAAITFACCGASVLAYSAAGTFGPSLVIAYLGYVLAWMLGDYIRVRRLLIADLRERAERLEREREERASAAVAEERARIARELHDVVAHHVSVIVVQAGGARRVVESDPAAARDALVAVEQAGRTALAEMRRMLEVLRAEQSGLMPQPGMAEIEALVAQVRGAGLPVELTVEGERRELPAGIDLAAYRIVQEALTNTVKHAGKAHASVRVTYHAHAIELEILDDGRGAAASLGREEQRGHGLIGMRERALLYGGELRVGPRLSGGFRVAVRLPLPAPEGHQADGRCCSALHEMAEAIGDVPGVPFRGTVYPWPEYP